MAKNSITTNELTGIRVVGGKNGNRRVGKVRRIVFHPRDKRVIGFIVKRPDLLWMFRRKDKFVSIDGYDVVDGRICIRNTPDATDKAACKSLGVEWDDCVLWIGLPILSADGTEYGFVGNVVFDRLTGGIRSLETDGGAASNALLGRREIPASMIKGFRRGIGMVLTQTGRVADEEAPPDLGAILVSDEVASIVAEGGVAEKAGAATAVVADKADKVVKKTGEAVNKGAQAVGDQAVKTKDAFSEFKQEFRKESGSAERAKALEGKTAESSEKKTSEAINKGAKAVGNHLKKSQGMFSAFKDEYSKARKDDK